MPRVCQITGRRTRTGNKVARRGLPKWKGGIGLKTTGIERRVFKPNLQSKRIWVEELGHFVRVRLSVRALKTIDKNGAYKTLVDAGLIKPLKDKKKASG
jgi:large subunit ribosomal protein L28